jgi:hypothetical protein
MIKRQREKIKPNPIISVVGNKKQIPGNVKGGVVAKAFVSKGGKRQRIYLVKGKTSKSDRLHEEGHIAYGHYQDKKYITVRQYMLDELNADLYAYERIGKPEHIKMKLRGIINEMVERSGLSPMVVYNGLRSLVFNLEGVPQTWKDDVTELRKEIRK